MFCPGRRPGRAERRAGGRRRFLLARLSPPPPSITCAPVPQLNPTIGGRNASEISRRKCPILPAWASRLRINLRAQPSSLLFTAAQPRHPARTLGQAQGAASRLGSGNSAQPSPHRLPNPHDGRQQVRSGGAATWWAAPMGRRRRQERRRGRPLMPHSPGSPGCSSLTAALLGKAVQLHRAPGTRQCKNPARSSGAPRLRQLADGPLDVCVELLLAESPEGRPCCILPPGGADAPTCSGKVRAGRGTWGA